MIVGGNLKIDNVIVQPDDGKYEYDHITPSTTASLGDLRDSNADKDTSRTVCLHEDLHEIRTLDFEKNKCVFSMDDLTAPLEKLLDPIRQRDKALWENPKNREVILKFGHRPEELSEGYSMGHDDDWEGIRNRLREKSFDPRQATAYVLNEKIIDVSNVSAYNFVFYKPSLPALDDEGAFLVTQREAARRSYFRKMRIANVDSFCVHGTNLIELSQTLEMYSESPEGIRGGCNVYQTKQHEETKMLVIDACVKALKEGGVPEAEAQRAVTRMLTMADVKRDGTSKSKGNSWVDELTPEDAQGALQWRISHIGSNLNINDLYKKGGVFKPRILTDRLKSYKESCQEVQRGDSLPSIWTLKDSLEWPESEFPRSGSPTLGPQNFSESESPRLSRRGSGEESSYYKNYTYL